MTHDYESFTEFVSTIATLDKLGVAWTAAGLTNLADPIVPGARIYRVWVPPPSDPLDTADAA